LPKSLPFIHNIHDLGDDEKQCACGCALTHIGDEISEQLDVVPQMTFRILKSITTNPNAPSNPLLLVAKTGYSMGMLWALRRAVFCFH